MFYIDGLSILITSENRDVLKKFYCENSDIKNKSFDHGYYMGFSIHDKRFMFAKNKNSVREITVDTNEFFEYCLQNR